MRCIYVRFDKKTFAGAKVQQFFDICKRKVDKMTPKGGQNGTKVDNLAGMEGLARRLQYSG